MLAQGNKVELIGTYGDDGMHALSAWTSTSRELTSEKIERIPKLLHMLGSEGHGTPFEKSMLHFLVTTDVSCHIQLLKHRAGVSINAESARYKELKDDKFYVPVDWDEEEREKYIQFMEDSLRQYHETLNRLVSKGIPRKRAKESARFYIPYGNQIVSDISFNFRSFMHFQGLRNSDHAQLEVKQVAEEMLRLVRETGKFDASLKAFGY